MSKKEPDKRARWKLRNPWARYVEYARRRCACTDTKRWWPFYGAKGIKVELTAADLKVVWERDNAAGMKRPSLDRIDPDRNYSVGNVRFVEFDLNARMAWDPTARDGYAEQAPEFV